MKSLTDFIKESINESATDVISFIAEIFCDEDDKKGSVKVKKLIKSFVSLTGIKSIDELGMATSDKNTLSSFVSDVDNIEEDESILDMENNKDIKYIVDYGGDGGIKGGIVNNCLYLFVEGDPYDMKFYKK